MQYLLHTLNMLLKFGVYVIILYSQISHT